MDIKAEIAINRPPPVVAEFVMNPENGPVWQKSLVEAKVLTPPPIGKGTRVQWTARFMGRRMHYVTEVTEHVPGQCIVLKTDKPFPMDITYRTEPDGGGSRFVARLQGGPGGLARLAAPLMHVAVKRSINGDLRRLKRLLEQPAAR